MDGEIWNTIPVAAGQRGRASIDIGPVFGNPDAELVVANLPASLAVNGRLQIRLSAMFLGVDEPLHLQLLDAGAAEPPADAYLAWADTVGLTPPNDGRYDDKDGDGVANVLEWVFGTDPLTPGPSDAGILAERVGDTFVFSFDRDKSTIGSVALALEYGSNLEGWTAVAVPENSQGIFTIIDAGDYENITATLPANGMDKLFVRLKRNKNHAPPPATVGGHGNHKHGPYFGLHRPRRAIHHAP